MAETKGHSEEYFGAYRDFWWNQDFLDLMARRWALSKYSTMLDVGCGRCHWSKLLVPYLRRPAELTAYDRDPKWALGDAGLIKEFAAMEATVSFQHGDAHQMPMADATFEVATCQTVLMHCARPLEVLREMKRVTKPGGLVICAEPSNMANVSALSSLDWSLEVETLVDQYREALLVQRGKETVGEGNNSIGDQLPALFHQAGLREIRIYTSDRAHPWIPPYDEPGQQANIQEAKLQAEPAAKQEVYEKARRYVTALGDPSLLGFLEKRHRLEDEHEQEFFAALERQEYYAAGLGVIYLASGRVS